MNQEQLVAAIVAEVKRVLTLRGIAVEPGGGTAQQSALPTVKPASSYHSRSAGTPVNRNTPATTQPQASGDSSDLTGLAVITRKAIEGAAGGQVRVAPRAVITPMANDYAREQGIAFVRDGAARQAAQSGHSSAVLPVAAVAVDPAFKGGNGDIAGLFGRSGVRADVVTASSYEAAVTRCAEMVASGTAGFGVCIERTGLAGPVYANRNAHIRAVTCRNVSDVRAARRDIDANIIVLDSLSLAPQVLAEMTGKRV